MTTMMTPTTTTYVADVTRTHLRADGGELDVGEAYVVTFAAQLVLRLVDLAVHVRCQVAVKHTSTRKMNSKHYVIHGDVISDVVL